MGRAVHHRQLQARRVGASVRYFVFFGTPRIMHFLTRVGVSPKGANAHYCLDLECDIDGLRRLDDAAFAESLAQEPRPIYGIGTGSIVIPLKRKATDE
jgi:hypothetical protein